MLTLPLWGPAMIVVALWITVASKGPVIYWQERIGLREKRFTMFKFRTMKVSAETKSHESYFTHLIESDAPMTKLDTTGDSRLIPLGAFLRAAGSGRAATNLQRYSRRNESGRSTSMHPVRTSTLRG